MSFYTDPAFFVIAAVLAVPAVMLGLLARHCRYYSLVASVIMLAFLLGSDLRETATLLGCLALCFGLTQGVLKLFQKEARHRVRLFRVALALMVCPLLAVKVCGLFGDNLFGFVGVSYLTFKTVQVLIEVRDGLIRHVSLLDYLSFLLFFPVFVSGPITRSRDYVGQMNDALTRDGYVQLLAEGILWMLRGVMYTFVLASFFEWLMWFAPASIVGSSWQCEALRQLSYAFAYGLYLFFDFAGYSFMAMGFGAFFGIRVPLNFNAPFRSIDIKDFWNRWHITLSFWLRDFVFMRMMRSVMKHKLFASRTTGACLGYLVEMTLMGAWHGLTPSYLLYGVYHGVLLASCELFQKTGLYKRNRRKRWFKLASWAITMIAVFFGFSLFSGQVVSVILGGR